jgi:hypothetical protein
MVDSFVEDSHRTKVSNIRRQLGFARFECCEVRHGHESVVRFVRDRKQFTDWSHTLMMCPSTGNRKRYAMLVASSGRGDANDIEGRGRAALSDDHPLAIFPIECRRALGIRESRGDRNHTCANVVSTRVDVRERDDLAIVACPKHVPA